jgi:hypothetical protein
VSGSLRSEDRAAARASRSARSPATWAALLGGLAGVGFAVVGVDLLATGSDLPLALSFGMILAGAIQVVCGLYSIRRVRAAWAFALSLNGTAFVVFLFGAPKIRDAPGVPIAAALAPCLIFALITTLYALSADDY